VEYQLVFVFITALVGSMNTLVTIGMLGRLVLEWQL